MTFHYSVMANKAEAQSAQSKQCMAPPGSREAHHLTAAQ